MWKLAAGLDWNTIAQLSQKWANRYELMLAMSFVEHLESLPEAETGRILFDVEGTDKATETMASELKQMIRRKPVLGLLAEIGIPTLPEVLQSPAGSG